MSEKVVYAQSCPVCNRKTIHATSVSEDAENKVVGIWFTCTCGVVFQNKPHEKIAKDSIYMMNHYKIKDKDVLVHTARTYATVLEECTYGRKFLDVGFGCQAVMEFMKERGWLCWGIDSNKDISDTDRIIQGDFETTDKIIKDFYDVIWMGNVLEKFHNPIGALHRAYEALHEDGVLFISTPDIDFLKLLNPGAWGNWSKKENYILWSTNALKRELERAGFDIIMCRRNPCGRFGYYNDMHIIAQKIYF